MENADDHKFLLPIRKLTSLSLFSSLAVQGRPRALETAKFKCVVWVAAIYPWQNDDFCPSSETFRMFNAEQEEKFLEGYPSIDVLRRKRNKFPGVAE